MAVAAFTRDMTGIKSTKLDHDKREKR